MESNNATKMTMTSGDVIEDSETTVEIKIKTLDSQTYTLRVNKYVPVPALKEQIATVTGVLSEQQRLICRGKVLKDDQLLSAYHVEDGHTLHLVVRQPHHSSSPSTSYMGPDIATGQPAANLAPDSARNRSNHVARSFVFETVNMDQGDIDTSWIGQILSSVMDSLGPTAGTRSSRVDLREMGSERLGRASSDGGQRPPTSTAGTAGFRFAPTVALSSQNPTVLPDSLTTLHHYLGFMRDGFGRERFGVNGRENRNNSETTGMRHNEGHGSLPSPSSLAEIVLSTRQLFMEQVAECFEHLTRQLEGHTSVTDATARINIQNTAARYAVLMQNLGSLLLELGRATGTLRMGQTAAEAFVNAGPATFISASGPNPLMVQMAPFYPGSNLGGIHMGSINSGHNPESEALDSPFLPRNIEVRIRTVGRAVPVDSANGVEQMGAQTQEPTDPSRNSSAPNVHQTFSAVLGGESGVRVVPFRTVVAIPGVNHSASDSSGSGVGLMYPVFTRLRQRSNTGDARTSQAFSGHHPGAPEVDRQPNSESAVQRQNVEEFNTEGTMRAHQFSVNTVPLAPGIGLSASESSENQGSSRVFTSSQQSPPNSNGESGTAGNDGRETGRLPMAQLLSQILSTLIPGEQVNVDAVNHPDNFTAPEQSQASRDAEPHGTGVGNDQGVFFSNLLRQVMPLIPQGTTLQPEEPANSRSSTVQTESGNDPSSSQHHRDAPESPNAKRLKREES